MQIGEITKTLKKIYYSLKNLSNKIKFEQINLRDHLISLIWLSKQVFIEQALSTISRVKKKKHP